MNISTNGLESISVLKEFNKEYPKTLKKDNINNVLENLKKRKNNK